MIYNIYNIYILKRKNIERKTSFYKIFHNNQKQCDEIMLLFIDVRG